MCLLNHRGEEGAVGGAHAVEVDSGVEPYEQLLPRTLKHLEHEVILQVVHKVDHLVAQQEAAVHAAVAARVAGTNKNRYDTCTKAVAACSPDETSDI